MKVNKYFFLSICVMFLLPAPVVFPQTTPGQIVSHEPNQEIVYHWFSYVPISINKKEINFILIAGQNGNIGSDDYSQLIQETRKLLEYRLDLAEQFKYIILTPVIPRSGTNWEIYSVALDRESLLSSNEFLRRPDLKVNLMIDEFIKTLRADGYNVHDKVFIEGFSAGAMFAQRYCQLHPERVQAIAAGQCGGSATIPAEKHNGIDMNWPVGVNDFESLVGYAFNFDTYKQVPQFLYIGDKDSVNSTVSTGNYGLFTDEQRNFLNATFGDTDPVRLQNQCDYMKELGCNVQFKLYQGVGHQYTSDIVNDYLNFFNSYKKSYTLAITTNGTKWDKVTGNPPGIDCPETCSAKYAMNTQISLTAIPSPGSAFLEWDGDCSGSSITCTVTMDKDNSVRATFLPPPEAISVPSSLSGPTNGIIGTAYTYNAGGSSSNLGHSIQYLFAWGDGTDSGWLPVGQTSASKSWASASTYSVRAQARCSTHTSVVSSWSGTITVNQSGKNPLNDTTEFVKQQYRDFLNREAETAGLQFWVNIIDSGAMTRAQVIESFFWSNEFGATIAPIVRLYFAYFLRIPDYGGLMYWIDQFSNGQSLEAISDAFAASSEFQQTYGALSNEGFVNLIYQNILGRAHDPGGYAFWVGELNSGRQTRGQVMIGFSESAEYEGLTNHEVYVTMMYIGMLRRSPEQEGFNFWVDYLDGGNSGLSLIDGFLNSQEYADRF